MPGKPRKKKNNTDATRGDRATRGHDIALGQGGNRDVWVWMCRKCNMEQSNRSLFNWAGWLRMKGDPRAEYVAELAEFIDRWRTENNVPAKTYDRRGAYARHLVIADA